MGFHEKRVIQKQNIKINWEKTKKPKRTLVLMPCGSSKKAVSKTESFGLFHFFSFSHHYNKTQHKQVQPYKHIMKPQMENLGLKKLILYPLKSKIKSHSEIILFTFFYVLKKIYYIEFKK